MGANTHPIFTRDPNHKGVTFVLADGTALKDLVTAVGKPAGVKVTSIAVTSDDTVTRVAKLYLHDGTTAYLVGAKSIPTLSGTDGAANAVELLDPVVMPWLDSEGGFTLPVGWKVQVGMLSAVTTAKTVTLVCLGGDY